VKKSQKCQILLILSDISGLPLKGDEPKKNPSKKTNSFGFEE
jgi:hypothetical protein